MGTFYVSLPHLFRAPKVLGGGYWLGWVGKRIGVRYNGNVATASSTYAGRFFFIVVNIETQFTRRAHTCCTENGIVRIRNKQIVYMLQRK